ncbi:energy-coupling factor transporter ATPase [Aquibacillus sediminis]|uniref:energy-coupling factor transporter ATPase n=1 Tax=Aquibacillus sediminis TaxID=2574734 RepID=UPI0011084373|nr:energy-coupling factor transporter ATPase [Aquibacillus sediminis]
MKEPIVQMDNIVFRYDRRIQQETISNVSLAVEEGEGLAIVGDNGSGKSTLAQMLVGLLTPQQGSIRILGKVLNDNTKWELRRQIGLVFQNPDNQFVGTTVQDDIAFGLENLNMPLQEMRKRVEQALEMVDMLEYRFHDPSRLSGGQKQRVAIAGILALNPSILVLDEALVMLDPKSRRLLLSTLHDLKRNNGLTIISITHDMDEAAAADRMVVLKKGRVEMEGYPSDVFVKKQELEAPFAERIRRILAQHGCGVPNKYMTEQEMVQWLWK